MAVEILAGLGVVFAVLAVFFSYKLSREVQGEHYWVFFTIAALGFGVAQGVRTASTFGGWNSPYGETLEQVGLVIGLFSLAYASYGLYASMERVRKRLAG